MKSAEITNPKANCGNTPLHKAATYGRVKIFELIINSIEDMNPKNNQGKTPFALAAENNQFKILDVPLKTKICCKKRKADGSLRWSKRTRTK